MCQIFKPQQCQYHALVTLRDQIRHRIAVCNEAILHSERSFQSIGVFNHRLKVRTGLYEDLQYVERGLIAMKNAWRFDTFDAMEALTKAGVLFNQRNGQIIILPQPIPHQ